MDPSAIKGIGARDGVRIAYRVTGTGPARLMLVHSLAMDGSFWQPVADRLGDVATVIALDCRGHGASDKPVGPYTVEAFADDLADVMAAERWPAATVVGASMGGCVTLAFAGRHPDKLLGLGLFDTTAWYGPDAPRQWAERAEKAAAEGLSGLVAFQKTRWFGDAFRAAHPRVVDDSIAVFLKNDVRAYADTCRMLGAADLRGVLPNIAVPTRIAVGAEDYATPVAMAEAMHALISQSRMTVLAGCRHLTPLEDPDRVADEIRAILEAST